MEKNLIYISGKEFLRKLLPPYEERDFSKIKLEEKFNLSGDKRFNELQDYLRREHARGLLKSNPISLREAQIKGLKANNIFLPHLDGYGASLEFVDFSNAYLLRFSFLEACIADGNFNKADLSEARLNSVGMRRTVFNETDFDKADFNKSFFWECDFRNAENLEKVLNLRYAAFEKTKFNDKERKMIELTGADIVM